MKYDFLRHIPEPQRTQVVQQIGRGHIDPNEKFVPGEKAEKLKGKLVQPHTLGDSTYRHLKRAIVASMPRETANKVSTGKLRIKGINAPFLNEMPPGVVQYVVRNVGDKRISRLKAHLNWLADHD